MLRTTFSDRLLLSLNHHFSKAFVLIISLCITFSTYAYAKVAKVCHETIRLNVSAVGSICAETNINSILLQNDLVRGMKLDEEAIHTTTPQQQLMKFLGNIHGFSFIPRNLSAQEHSSQHGILLLVKLNFGTTKLQFQPYHRGTRLGAWSP